MHGCLTNKNVWNSPLLSPPFESLVFIFVNSHGLFHGDFWAVLNLISWEFWMWFSGLMVNCTWWAKHQHLIPHDLFSKFLFFFISSPYLADFFETRSTFDSFAQSKFIEFLGTYLDISFVRFPMGALKPSFWILLSKPHLGRGIRNSWKISNPFGQYLLGIYYIPMG